MVTIDTQKAILTYIYNLLTTDATLKSAMGGTVRLYPTWAKPDAEFPYLVHRLDIASVDFFPMRMAAYYLDIWSDSPSAEEILTIRTQIITLLDELEPSIDEVSAARLWLQTDGFVPESEQDIWHYVTLWNLRYYRKSEVSAILAR